MAAAHCVMTSRLHDAATVSAEGHCVDVPGADSL
jgi:hypothetical protein